MANPKNSVIDQLSSIAESRVIRIGANLFYILNVQTSTLSLCVSAVPPPIPSNDDADVHVEHGLAAEIRYFKRSKVIELVARDSSGESLANVELRLGDFLDLLGVSGNDCSLL